MQQILLSLISVVVVCIVSCQGMPKTTTITTTATKTSSYNDHLYWYDYFGRFVFGGENDFHYRAATWERTYSINDCPFTSDWFPVTGGVDECKRICMEENTDWDYQSIDPDTETTIPPSCTSISFDPLSTECVLRRCELFPMILPEMSTWHTDMAVLFPQRYGGSNRSRESYTLIQDYALHTFDDTSPLGDSRCPLPYETFRRIQPSKTDFNQNEGSFVCELDEVIEEYYIDTNDKPLPLLNSSMFFDRDPPVFENCWEGMSEAIEADEYLTYWFAIEVKKDWKEHFDDFKEDFNRHGYYSVEESVNIVWDNAKWIFQQQFQIDLRISRVVVQNDDGSYDSNPWRPGDAGLVRLSKAYNGGTGVAQTCTPKDMVVGDFIFNKEKPGLFHINAIGVLVHEMAHFFGQSHSPIYRPDMMQAEGLLSYRRCIDNNDPSKQKICSYRSFFPINNAPTIYKFSENLCKHLRSEQAQSCSMVRTIDDDNESPTVSPVSSPPKSNLCPLESQVSLCNDPNKPCKYAGSGKNWDGGDRAGCPELDGYKRIFRERNETTGLWSDSSKYACEFALTDMINSGINIQLGTDIRVTPGEMKDPIVSIYSFDRPTGCFIECLDGILYGFFNSNPGNYLDNPGNNAAEPLCVLESSVATPTTAPYTIVPTRSVSTESPTTKSPSCVNRKDYLWKNKPGKNCRWAKRGSRKQKKKKCKKKDTFYGKNVAFHCRKTCAKVNVGPCK